MPPTWVFLAITAGLFLLGSVPGLHQKRKLRGVWARPPIGNQAFCSLMKEAASQEAVIEKVRKHLASGVICLPWQKMDGQCILPQDRIVADLGIGAGPVDFLEGAAIIEALERDLGISIPDEEAEAVDTVEDLVHLCERCRARRSGQGKAEQGRDYGK